MQMKFKLLRVEHGLSQEELSELLGVSQQYISLLENGTRKASSKLIYKIEELFGVKDIFIA